MGDIFLVSTFLGLGFYGLGPLVNQCKGILANHLCPMVKHFCPDGNSLFKCDNGTIHRAREHTERFDGYKNDVNHVLWSLQSPNHTYKLFWRLVVCQQYAVGFSFNLAHICICWKLELAFFRFTFNSFWNVMAGLKRTSGNPKQEKCFATGLSMPSGPWLKLPLLQWGNQLGRSDDHTPFPWWPSCGNVYPDCFVSFGLCSVCGHLTLFWETLTAALCILDWMLVSFVRLDSFSDTALMGFLFVALSLLCHVALLILEMPH